MNLMNTLLKTIATLFAAGFPVAFSAESFGVSLPELFNAAHMFGAFVVAVTLLTMLTDYTEPKALGARRTPVTAGAPAQRTVLPLAA